MPRKVYRKKRSYRKRRTMTGRVYRKPQSYFIKRTCALAANVETGVAADNVIWNQASRSRGYFNFSLSDLPNNGEITAMFNRYKLTGVQLKLIPIVGTDATAGATTFMDTLAIHVDKSVRGVPANMDEILEAGNCRIYSGALRPLKIWIGKPLAASTIGGVSGMMTNPWLDTDQNAIKHYGVRYAFSQSLASAAVRFQVYATYFLRVRGLK